jgi:hypothetical protein
VDPVPDPLLFRKSGSAESNPGLLDLLPGTLTTRPQRRSKEYYISQIIVELRADTKTNIGCTLIFQKKLSCVEASFNLPSNPNK